jgi:hypothetical protein
MRWTRTVMNQHHVLFLNIITLRQQVLLHECPKKLKDLLRKDELPPPGQSPVLVFEFASADKVSSLP